MADTGKIPKLGFGAGGIEFVTLLGFNPNPTGAMSLTDVYNQLVIINTTLLSMRPLLEHIAFKKM